MIWLIPFATSPPACLDGEVFPRSLDLPLCWIIVYLKKLIRSRDRKAFLTEDGDWSPDRARGLQFGSDAEAKAAITRLHLENVELYYSFQDDGCDERWDFAVPLTGAGQDEVRL